MHEFEQRVLETVRKVAERPAATLESQLARELGIDSLSFIRLVVALEEQLAVRFEDDYLALAPFSDVRSLSSYLYQQSLMVQG